MELSGVLGVVLAEAALPSLALDAGGSGRHDGGAGYCAGGAGGAAACSRIIRRMGRSVKNVSMTCF